MKNVAPVKNKYVIAVILRC